MKKLTILMLVVVMVLGLMLLAVGARGPVNKVTGEIWVEVEEESGHFAFDAHETEDDATKGTIYWFWFEGHDPEPNDVLCCNVVDENTAWFVVETEEVEDVWIVVKVVDGGSPGAGNDELYFEYVYYDLGAACAMVASATSATELPFEATIVEGNLVVHYYE